MSPLEELKNRLESADDKLSILQNQDMLESCIERRSIYIDKSKLYKSDVISLINKFLSDSEKAEMLQLTYIDKLGADAKFSILNTISDENLKLQFLSDVTFASGLSSFEKSTIIAKLSNDNDKLKLLNMYAFDIIDKVTVYRTLSDEAKINVLIENTSELEKKYMHSLISSLSTNSLNNFFNVHKDVLSQTGIKPYQITYVLPVEKQIEFVKEMENSCLTDTEKKLILVTLQEQSKIKLRNIKGFPDMYYKTLSIVSKLKDSTEEANQNSPSYEKSNYSTADYANLSNMQLIINYEDNMALYSGLDELIKINPTPMKLNEQIKFLKLYSVCPNLSIIDECGVSDPKTTAKCKKCLSWIETTLAGIQEDWSDIQKVAYLANCIGKSISYSPYFGTHLFDEKKTRTIWEITDSGYAVCNGIAYLYKYLANEVNISMDVVRGSSHFFVLVKNIDLPTPNGESINGNTIIDPTWDLTRYRFGCMPLNFGKNYTNIRLNDIQETINIDGSIEQYDDKFAHFNKQLDDISTVELPNECIRNLFTSIGIADSDGNFNFKNLYDKFKELSTENLSTEELISKRLELFTTYFPDFATCPNSTQGILPYVILSESYNLEECVIQRVYERVDKDKKPVTYVYLHLPNNNKSFYYADSESKTFKCVTQERFEEMFECYEEDLEQTNGINPWDNIDVASSNKTESVFRDYATPNNIER